MKVTYDPTKDVLTVELKPGPVAESDDGKPGVILDYDEQGNLIGVEVLDASRRVADVRSMQFQVSG
jgi:YD repeat-containing protein